MRRLFTKIEIETSPQKIWEILQDVNFYATWNPFIIYARGDFVQGAKFTFILKAPGEKPKLFKSHITSIEKQREFRWLNSALLPGILNIEHIFRLTPIESDRTRFEYEQHFSGIMGRFLFNRLEYAYLAGMKKMNKALKELCELKNTKNERST